MQKLYIGCDVSKSKIDIALLDIDKTLVGQFCVENIETSLTKFFKKYMKENELLVVCEATGVYHHRLIYVLEKLQTPYAVVNPMIIHNHRKSLMRSAKTDSIDAKVIADYAVRYNPEPSKQNPEFMLWSQSILKGIDDLHHELTSINNRVEALSNSPYSSKEVLHAMKQLATTITSKIKHLEELIVRRMRAEKNDELILLKNIPGVGDRLATTIIAFMGSFETFDTAKQVISFIGTDPSPRESGSFKGQRKISKQGNRYVRHILYMAAIAASRYNEPCVELCTRLKEKGKHGKQVLVAVGNKLMRQIFAVAKYAQPWREDYRKSNPLLLT